MIGTILFGTCLASVAINAEALDKARFKALKEHNDLYSDEIRENLKLESTRYQCWKTTRCTHDKVSVCCCDLDLDKEPKPRGPDYRIFRMFDDECAMYVHNCEHGTMYEVSVSKSLCSRANEVPVGPVDSKVEGRPGKDGRRKFLPKPKVQMVRGIPNKYYI